VTCGRFAGGGSLWGLVDIAREGHLPDADERSTGPRDERDLPVRPGNRTPVAASEGAMPAINAGSNMECVVQ